MTKDQVASALREIGTILELQGENPFKCRAYLNGARTLETSATDLTELVRTNRLGELPGIGDALREKITTLITTGKLPYLEELRSSIPAGLLPLLDLPGLGPKKLRALRDKLKIESLEALTQACQDGRLAALEGFGEKTATNLLEAIDRHANYKKLHRLGTALPAARTLLEHLKQSPLVLHAEIAGSLRRGKEVVKDLDLIASSKKPKEVMKLFVSSPNVEKVVNHGETKSSVILTGGIPCDLRVIPPESWATALAHFTGSKEHNIALRQRAIDRGLHLSEWGLLKGKSKTPLKLKDEKDLHKALGLAFIPPELREDSGEIAAAEERRASRSPHPRPDPRLSPQPHPSQRWAGLSLFHGSGRCRTRTRVVGYRRPLQILLPSERVGRKTSRKADRGNSPPQLQKTQVHPPFRNRVRYSQRRKTRFSRLPSLWTRLCRGIRPLRFYLR